MWFITKLANGWHIYGLIVQSTPEVCHYVAIHNVKFPLNHSNLEKLLEMVK